MYRVKKGLVVLTGFLLITGFFSASKAIAKEHAWRHGRFNKNPLGVLSKLNLTATQKTEVAAILKSNEAKSKTIANELANAGMQIRKDVLNGSYNADHFKALTNYEQQAIQHRATVMAAILPKLTKNQRATLEKLQAKFDSRTKSAINNRFARMDKWIATHSKKA